MTKHFCLILTEEGSVRFARLRKMHGFLIDRNRKKAYAIVKEAVPTTWPGRFARCYVLNERTAQTVRFQTAAHDETMGLEPELLMEKKVTPTADAPQEVLELTSDVLYDTVDGLLVRRLGIQKLNWAQALLLAAGGGAVTFIVWASGKLFL